MATSATLRRTFPRELAELLRARIFRGELKPGELLPPERELALALGTNRGTLREALRALESQGLVQARQGQGVRVLDFKAVGELTLLADYFRVAEPFEQIRLIADLVGLRSLVAREVVRRAALHADEGDFLRLDESVAELRRAALRGQGLVRAELGIYRAAVTAGKSLANTWLFNTLERVTTDFGDSYPDLWITPPRFVERWQEIVEAIRSRDADASERTLVALLGDTDAALMDLLGFPDGPSRRRKKRRAKR